MTDQVAVLGAGVHGREIATVIFSELAPLFDDRVDGLAPVDGWDGDYVAGAAMPEVRRRIVGRAAGTPWKGTGNVIFPGAKVSPTATFGSHVHVGYNAVISHGCHLADFVQVCAGAVLAGEVTVGEGVFIGANATIIHGGIKIGDWATVGAGAVVTSSVDVGATVAGVPARLVRRPWAAP